MGVLRKKKTKGRPAAPPQPKEGTTLTGSKMSLTPSLESASLDLDEEVEQGERDKVNL